MDEEFKNAIIYNAILQKMEILICKRIDHVMALRGNVNYSNIDIFLKIISNTDKEWNSIKLCIFMEYWALYPIL